MNQTWPPQVSPPHWNFALSPMQHGAIRKWHHKGFLLNWNTTTSIFLLIGLIPLIFIAAFSGLELAIAFIQAQVFVVLSCSYIKDALELH